MRIPSGVTDQVIYFVAVDSTDLETRETGLTSFTVYRDRNGGGATAMTTPTVTEVDATNMPGVYKLLCDEDMTIGAGNDSEEMAYHITQASMAPVTRTIEIYRRTVTSGDTLDITAGDLTGGVDLNATQGAITWDAQTFSVVGATDNITFAGSGTGDVFSFTRSGSGDLYDTAYSASLQAEVNAACDTSLTDYDGPTNAEMVARTLATAEYFDPTTDSVALSATGLDAIASTATGMVEIAKAIWDRILTGGTHNITNSAGRRLRQVSTAVVFTDGTAQSGSANTLQLAIGDVTIDDQFQRAKVLIVAGTGSNQEAIITSSVAATDTVTVTPSWIVTPDATSEYQVIPAQAHTTTQDGGYTGGKVYIDTVNGVAGTQIGVNGIDTNPVSNMADAYTIATDKNLTDFHAIAGSALILPSDSTGLTFEGEGYTVDLNGQEIGSVKILDAVSITGIGVNTSGGQKPFFEGCGIGSVTLPPSIGNVCGFFGTLTIGAEGDFTFGSSTSVFDTTLTIDYGSGNNASSVFVTGWTGGSIEIQNAGAGTGSYRFDMTGTGDLTVNANCSADTTVKLGGAVSRNADVTGVVYSELENVVDILGDVKGSTFSTSTDSLEAIRDRGDVAWLTGAGGSAPTVGEIADAVWDEPKAGHTTADTFGDYLDTEVSGVSGGSGLTSQETRDAMKLSPTAGVPAAGSIDDQLDAIPTATENADTLLNRDMNAVSDTNSRTLLNAIRFLRNKWSLSGTTLTVTKEDDTTTAWDATVSTDAAADPVTGSDPT